MKSSVRRLIISVLAIAISSCSVVDASAKTSQAWNRLRDEVMQLREAGRPQDAYATVTQYRCSNAADEVDREFLAGFLALRALGRPDVALGHFKEMAVATASLRAADDPAWSRATAGYWLGRTLQILGKTEEARQIYSTAAMYRSTFYGLLAASQVGLVDTRSAVAPVAPNYPKPQLFWHDPRMNDALVFAVIKSESNFQATAVSGAGAQGWMQLMPGTVRAISRQTGVPLDPRMVAVDPNYNVAVGSHHFADLLTRYGGNVSLAAAGYNAGSQSSDNWIARFGDPRSGAIDIVDWIELIPFHETRHYVKKVVANYVTYIALGDSK